MRVLVTGANGHIGFNLCKALIDRGHSVRASVRSLADTGKSAPLRTLGPIELVEVDLYKPEQLRAALSGVDLFFHLAAVYQYVVKRGREEDEVVRPSVEGADNAIRAAADAKVRKVVMTSSAVTLPLTPPGAPPSTEEDWTDDVQVPYLRAKTLAEKRAWELARELNVNLVTVLPGAVCGPGFVRNTPSIDTLEGIMLGTMRMGAPDTNFPYVDVRDVVSAHVLAGEQDCAGRFTVCNDHLPSFLELTAAMHAIDPKIPRAKSMIPKFAMGAAPFFDWLNHKLTGSPRVVTPELIATLRGKIWNASNARIKRELGWKQAIPLEASLRDTIDTIKANRTSRNATATRAQTIGSARARMIS
jgi:dihydroflavonol-4-reductase